MNGDKYPEKGKESRSEAHGLHLDGRNSLEIWGVSEVVAFDENCVCLDTVCGALDIEGSGLSVRDISLSEGRVSVTGKVGGLWYTEKKQKSEKRGAFFFGKR
ncbi:MAG: sporulation protein YabP [Clostridia bacterium]|nr:sporulation protein YabP [Clostridia bacterium]